MFVCVSAYREGYMKIHLVEYIEKAVQCWPERTAYQDGQEIITFFGVMDECQRIGTALCRLVPAGSPVIVLSSKNVHVASAYLGVASAGCFYVPLDAELPVYRLKLIFNIVKAEVVLTDGSIVLPEELSNTVRVVTLEDCLTVAPDIDALRERRIRQLDTDPLSLLSHKN
jgi:acyl-CoA synthetase (AMP-forming)/AMP-acid ligase II